MAELARIATAAKADEAAAAAAAAAAKAAEEKAKVDASLQRIEQEAKEAALSKIAAETEVVDEEEKELLGFPGQDPNAPLAPNKPQPDVHMLSRADALQQATTYAPVAASAGSARARTASRTPAATARGKSASASTRT